MATQYFGKRGRRAPAPRSRKTADHCAATLGIAFESHPDPMWVYDQDSLAFVEVNPAALERYGYSRAEFLKLTIKDIRPQGDVSRLVSSLEGAPSTVRRSGEWQHLTKDGQVLNVEVKSQALRFNGRGAVLVMATEIGQRKQAERAAARMQSLLNTTQEFANLGSWDWNIQSGDLFWSLQTYRQLGVKPGEFTPTFEALQEHIHPDDRAAFGSAIEQAITQRTPFQLDIRILQPTGDVRVLHARGEVLLSPDGEPERIVGYSLDVTDEIRSDAARRLENERFQRFIESNVVGIITISADGRVITANDYFLKTVGISRQELDEQTVDWIKITPPEWLPADEQAIHDLQARGVCGPYEKEFIRKDGTRVAVFFAAATLPGPGEQIAAFVLDITERKQSEARIERQVHRLSALRSIDAAIASSVELNLTLNILLAQAIYELWVDAAAVLLFNKSSNMLEYSTGAGFRGRGIAGLRQRPGEGFAGQALIEGRTVIVPDLAESLRPHSSPQLIVDERFVAFFAVPLVVKGQIKGVLELFHRSRLDPEPEWLDFLETLAGQAAVAIDNAQMFSDLQRSNTELSLAYNATIEGWSRAMDLHDKESEGHTQRVTEQTVQLARRLGISEGELSHVRRGSLLHDIGKMGISDEILHMARELTPAEWEIVKRHPVFAYELLSPIRYLKSAALEIPYCHHENWDGSGYPRGLMGESIPLAARIFTVVNVYDSLLSDRPYRKAWTREKALASLRERSGKQFDPQVVAEFLRMPQDE